MNTFLARARALVQRVFFWLPSSAPSEEHIPEAAHDHALILAVKSPRKFPSLRQIRYGIRVVLNTRERRTLFLAVIVFVIAGGAALGLLLKDRTVLVPVVGGTMTEGVVGEPASVNPVDAPANDVDRDIASLVYSGLFRMDGITPVPDLAESYSWSDDKKTLTVTLRSDARFHNDNPVTAEDVQFTIDSIQDPTRSSPLASAFRGIKAVATDSQTIQFTQAQTDATILQALTVGVLPSRLWQDIPAATARLADLNLKPIGSGPYRFKSFTRDSHGVLRTFTLERFDGYYGIGAYIKTVTFQFYPDRQQAEDALKGDLIDTLAFSSLLEGKNSSSRWHALELELPQETVAFFNLKDKTLSDENVRRAFAGTIDRQEIVDAWGGHAAPVSGPYPYTAPSSTVITLDEGRALLEKAGWVLASPEDTVRIAKKTASGKTSTTSTAATASSTELELTISTSDQPELITAADALARRWSLLGAKVTVEQLSLEELLKRATRDRNSDVILTNILLDSSQDLFPFWWSGQAVDRGLNISGLADRDLDTALEAVRTASTTSALDAARVTVSNLVIRTTPAAFLVRPFVPYLVAKKIHGVSNDLIVSRPADRFTDLKNWYISFGWRWK
ncbi:MAG: ABC transporter substrate-binding protein [Patescibacteria group bacterium]